MNEAADRRTAQELSRLGDGLAAHVSVPPVTRVIRRATPLRRALVRLEDVTADVSVPSVTRLIGQASSRRRALVAGCSICGLGAVGAALVFISGASNGSTGPNELWAQQAGGPNSGSQPSLLTMPQFSNDQVAQDANQQPTAQAVAPQPAPAKPAVPVPAAAKPAATNTAAATRAAANTAATNAAAARQAAAQSLAAQLPTTTQAPPTRTSTTLTGPGLCAASSGTSETVTAIATVSPPAAGSVQFMNSGSAGNPMPVSRGRASASITVTCAPQAQPLTAVFTPSDTTDFIGSTSNVYNVPAASTPKSSSPAAPLAAVNTQTPTSTVTPPPPAPPPPVAQVPRRAGHRQTAPPVEQAPVEQLQQQAPAYQIPQQAPAEQLPAQGSPRHH